MLSKAYYIIGVQEMLLIYICMIFMGEDELGSTTFICAPGMGEIGLPGTTTNEVK